MEEIRFTYAGLEITAYEKRDNKFDLYADKKLVGLSVDSKLVYEMKKNNTNQQKTLF